MNNCISFRVKVLGFVETSRNREKTAPFCLPVAELYTVHLVDILSIGPNDNTPVSTGAPHLMPGKKKKDNWNPCGRDNTVAIGPVQVAVNEPSTLVCTLIIFNAIVLG